MRVGGQGIRLLRQFADKLDYEQLPTGNPFKIGFSAKLPGSVLRVCGSLRAAAHPEKPCNEGEDYQDERNGSEIDL
jgi:hypothetical protein